MSNRTVGGQAPNPPGERTWTLYFLDENDETPQPLEVGEGLAQAVVRAEKVNQGLDRFAVSFSSLMIGLLAGNDPVGRWLQERLAESTFSLGALLKRRNMDVAALTRLRDAEIAGQDIATPRLRSLSARSALNEGQRLARDMGTLPDTRHVAAAYLSMPAYHEQDFREMSIDRAVWIRSFSEAMAGAYPAEASFWKSFPERVFPRQQSVADLAATAAPERVPVVLEAKFLEPHAAQALRVAARLAGNAPLDPHHLLRAVISVADKAGSPAFTRFAELAGLTPEQASEMPGSPLPELAKLGPTLLRQLTWAQRPDPGMSAPRLLWGRDLITAALLAEDPELARLFGGQQQLDALRDDWYAFVTAETRPRTLEAWKAWWLAAGVPLPGLQRAGYSTETDQGDDKLGIEGEARAFARLILDTDVKAPLSIGLLGDWGSGKSFFIEQIKKQIEALQKEQRPELFSNVVQIEFNAWHASDSNLWASLVTYIFDEIWDHVAANAQGKSPEEARKTLLKQIEQARGAVHETEVQVELARTALTVAEQELARRRAEVALNRFAERKSIDSLDSLAKAAGWHRQLETINDVEEAARSLAVASSRLRQVIAVLLEGPMRHIALPATLVLVGAVALWLASGTSAVSGWMKLLTKWVAVVVGSVGTVVTPLRSAGRKVAGLADQLEHIKQEYDKNVDAYAKERPAEVERLAAARRELDSAEASVAAAKARLGELLNEQASHDPRRRLGAFLQERVQSTRYRSQQGIISLVHRDFRQLSQYMQELRGAVTGAIGDPSGIKPMDRIVLYVDDLDRCRPDQVVNMLEAIHLLLALDLFVVVVAVDSRWLIRALQVHYKDLLAAMVDPESEGLRVSTPQGYLEKIFQITYALGPMEPSQFSRYIQFLAGEEEAGDAGRASTGGSSRAPKPAESAADRETGPAETGAAPAGSKGEAVDASKTDRKAGTMGEQAGETQGSQPMAPPPKPALPPARAVRIDKSEQALIISLVPLLPTPRIAKRLVNVYRLIKASKNDEALRIFQKENRARACLLMLAILFGRPAVASELLRGLHERRTPFDKPDEGIVEAMRRRVAPTEETSLVRDQWSELVQTLEILAADLTVGQCARESIEVARYSLVSGQDWHTWSRRVPDGPASSGPNAALPVSGKGQSDTGTAFGQDGGVEQLSATRTPLREGPR